MKSIKPGSDQNHDKTYNMNLLNPLKSIFYPKWLTRLFLPYNKTILKTNIFLSVFLTLISSLVILTKESPHSPVYLVVALYTFWIMTGGFLLSAFYFELSRRNEYYFYYNLGIGKIKLLLFTFTLHIIFILPLLFILQYV